MNVRATAHPMESRPTPPAARPRPMVDATLVALALDLTAVFFDRPGPAGPSRPRLAGEAGGLPVPKPFIAATFDLRTGGQRHALFMAQSLEAVLAQPLRLLLDGTAAATVDPGWLQPPVGELTALVEGLSDVGQKRLLRLLLTTGASLFAGTGAPGFVMAATRLMELCGIGACAPLAVAGFGKAQRILSYRLPAAGSFMPLTDPVALTAERAIRIKGAAAICEPCEAGDLLHIQLPPAAAEGAELVLFGDVPLRLQPAPPALRALPVPVWLEGRAAEVRDWAVACVGAAGASDRVSAALLRELAPGISEPRLNVLHLSATREGVVHALELSDPQRLVRAVVVERNGRRGEIAPALRVDGAGTLAGMLALPGGSVPGEPCRVSLLYHSGRLRTVASVPLAPFGGEIPQGFETAWREAAAAGRGGALPALARARLAALRDPIPAAVQHFGTRAPQADLCLVTGITDSVDMIRARAASVFAEASARRVKIVCTLSEGPLADAARRVVEEAVAVYAIPHRLVTVPKAASPAERLRAALVEAQGSAVLALAPEVLPARPGWLPFWLRRLGGARGEMIVGGALLTSDGAIEDTGEDDRFRGLPATRLPATLRNVAQVAPSCFGLSAAGVRTLLAAPLSHPDHEILVADCAARQSASGRGVTMDGRFPFTLYGPLPDTGPFERALRAETYALVTALGAGRGPTSAEVALAEAAA